MSESGVESVGDGSGRETSRRGFLRSSLALAAAASVSGASSLFGQDRGGDQGPSEGMLGSAKPRTNAPPGVSRVVQVVSERVLPVRIVQAALLKDCLVQGLCGLTGERDVGDAWHRILRPDDVILVKFNQSGAVRLGTREPMVTEVLNSLVSAGWGLDRIVVLEAGTGVRLVSKTLAADMRWQGQVVEFGSSGRDSFIAALDQATAIVNVPFLKIHHRAGMSCCLKNLSHGLVRHPSRFHANGCDPAIGEIVSSEAIKSKLRLNIVNALRVVFDRGPEAGEAETHVAGTVLFGRDPLACDATGYGILNGIRSLRGLGPLLSGARVPGQLVTAARLGLGRLDAEEIDVQRVEM